MLKGRVWLACTIVFIASFCTLVIELVAGRILAPFIGVSLYTWTSIIGICLAGISVGNYVGGRIADRRASATTLGLLFVLSSVASLGILLMTTLLVNLPALSGLGVMPRIVLLTTLIFFAPTFLLGTISPVVIKLTLSDLRETGSIVGRIYAWSTAGAIFGTFATGFFLIEAMGTRSIIWSVSIILLLMGLGIGAFWRSRAKIAGTAAAAAVFGVMGWNNQSFAAPCVVESSYFCIQVTQQTVDGRPLKALILDHLIHSYISLEDPTILGYGYERVYAELTDYFASERPRLHTLSIGGGGYTFPKYLEASYPDALIDVIEIDPAVTKASIDYLGLAPDSHVTSFNQDARQFFIERRPQKEYDIVYGDAFNDISIPYHLTTSEFNKMVRESVKDDGVFIANVIDNYKTGEFLRAYTNTLKLHFEHVYLFGLGRAWEGNGASTYVVAASPQPIDVEKFREFTSPRTSANKYSGILDNAAFAEYLGKGRQIILTDDYAPVDNLVAHLFVERGY
jgi:spermidine synthase